MPFSKNKHFAFKKMCSIRQLFCAVFLFVGLICLTLGLSRLTFAEPYTSVVKSVEINSQHANFANGDPGAWKVEKSARWIDEGKARITFDVNTIRKTADNTYTDIIMVIDNSGSMNGDKMAQVKADATELISSLLSNTNNRVALVNFESTATKLSNFTNNKANLLNLIGNLDVAGSTNYYDGFKKAEEILEGYQKQSNRELIMLFLTDGYPNEDTPNEVAEYRYLKQAYPYMTINGIQYEMGDEVLQPIIDISDNQYIANMNSLNNVLFEASVAPYTYENFTITDYIDDTYWNVDSIDSIEANIGEASLSYDGSTPKVTWVMNEELKTGRSATLTIDISLKSGLTLDANTFLPTNKNETVTSSLLENPDENITSTLTPVLKAKYNVSYEPNLPSDCASYTGTLPAESTHLPFAIVQKSSDAIACEGYNFNGWQIAEGDPKIINDDYFKIVSDDVVLRATWSKPSITKSMDGTVKEEIIATLTNGSAINVAFKRLAGQTGASYSTTNTTIIAVKSANSMSSAQQANATTISATNSMVPIYAWFDDTDGSIYIYSDAEKIMGTSSMDYLFYRLSNLTNIDAVAKWNMSKTRNMQLMFVADYSLTNLDALANWDISNVTNISGMFNAMSSLTDIDALANWDTSNVTTIGSLFSGSNNLENIDALASWDVSNVKSMTNTFTQTNISNLNALSAWDTSSVTNMRSMFDGTSSLTNIDGASGWDTSSVTNLSSMFSSTSITNVDALTNWDTSSVTDMSYMFSNATSLANIDGASNWNTSSVTNMNSMFRDASSLTNIDGASSWDTSSVTSMSQMFYNARVLSSLVPLSGWDTSSVTDMSSMFRFGSAGGEGSLDALSSWNTSSVTSMIQMFADNYNLTDINGVAGWDTSSVTNMRSMFSSISTTNVDALASWDTSSVTDMSSMFWQNSYLTNINGVSGWDTSNVTNMAHLFSATNIANIDALSSWNTSSVTDMSQMFYEAYSLTDISGASNWGTTNVTNMNYAFGRTKLTNVDALSRWNTSNVTDISYMFYNTSSLTDITGVSNWNTSSVTKMSGTFSMAVELSDISALADWNTSSVTKMDSLFYQDTKIVDISALTNWDTSNVMDMSRMFYNDYRITSLNPLFDWNVSSVTDMTNIFYSIPTSVARPSWYDGS